MKTMDVKRIGAVLGSVALIGAAIAAPAAASMYPQGLEKGFFYDASYHPIVQIVVGEGGMASDAVAAGNIAATIGNLAYMTKTGTITPTAGGEVVIETASIGAIGDYVQDERPDLETNTADFYDEDEGFSFEGTKTYERGDFTQYAMACEQQTREEAHVLLEGSFSNIHCLFCKTLCVEGLKNPSHDMKEIIEVDSDRITYYEEGLNSDDNEQLRMAIGKNAIKYTVETGYIPLEDMETGTDKFADFEYRGKIIFMGKEYYVRDIEGDKIILSEGEILEGINSEGYTTHDGYKFKIDNLIFSGEYVIAGILLDVEKPDGTLVQVQISKMANGAVDDYEIAGVYAQSSGSVDEASIIVYDKTTELILEDNKDLVLGDTEYEGWRVNWEDYTDKCDNLPDCDIDEYEDTDYKVLEKIEVTYNEELSGNGALGVDESLAFPSRFVLTFQGYRTDNFDEAACSGEDERIRLERGDEPHQLYLSFTGEDGQRYDEVRMDEGMMEKGDAFILDGTVWEYEKYEEIRGEDDKDDTVEVTRNPLISGSKERITLARVCDPEASNAEDCTDVGDTPTCDCGNIDVTLRKMALTDAIEDGDTDYERDEEVELDPEELFWAYDGEGGYSGILWFDADSNSIFYSNDIDDRMLAIEPDMVGSVSVFDTDNMLEMHVARECDLEDDPDIEDIDLDCDYNADAKSTSDDTGNDDDTLIVFRTNDEDDELTVIDMADRGYDEGVSYYYDNSVKLYSDFGDNREDNADDNIATIDDEEDEVLITPYSGTTYTIDWGVDNRIDRVDICHPTKTVDSTYFIGTGERLELREDRITPDDEGSEVTAGCCTFKVKEFDTETTEVTYTTNTPNTVGMLVVSETYADPMKNLIIVGGPVVNGMCTATKEEIGAETDKYVVRKDGNLLIVAGWEAEDTTNAGNELIGWLNANTH